MSTARDLIKDSLRKLGVIASGETLSAEEASDGLRTLKQMLEGWNTQKLIMHGIEIENFILVGGQASYALGSGGDFDTEEPVHVNAIFVKKDSVDYQVKIIDSKAYGEISYKDATSEIPTHAYIDYNHPLKKVYFYPVPSEANTVKFHNYRKLATLSNLSSVVSLPDGYERAIVYNLAIELAPEYGKSVGGEIMKIANESLANIKRANIKPVEAKIDNALLNRCVSYDWRNG